MRQLAPFWALLLAACGGGQPPSQSQRVAEVRLAPPPEAPPAQQWSVTWERTLGYTSALPLFGDSGELWAGGVGFAADGQFLRFAPAEVPSGRMIADMAALLPDGSALVSASGAENDDQLLVVPRGAPPEKATARAAVRAEAVAVDPEGQRVAVHSGDEIVVFALPALAEVARHSLGGALSRGAAVAFVAGGLAYTAPAADCRVHCSAASVLVRTGDDVRAIAEAPVDRVAFAPTGDAVAVWGGDRVTVQALPGGELVGEVVAPRTLEGELAVSAGGASVALLSCTTLTVFERASAGYAEVYRGVARATTRTDCASARGLRFSATGDRLALATGELTLLSRGVAGAAPATLDYAPTLPAGFRAVAAPDSGAVNPNGSGLAPAPRLAATFRYEGEGEGRAEVWVVVRDARQFAGTSIDGWAEQILVRFESLLRDEVDPNRLETIRGMPYRRQFVDDRGRRTLEYAIWIYDGCDPGERYVRYVQQGDQLVEITLNTWPGTDPALVRSWMRAFFDLPFGGVTPGRVLARKFDRSGGC